MAGKLGCILPKLDPSKHVFVRSVLIRKKDGSLPAIPATPFGRLGLILASVWLMLCNDVLGCCVIAAIYHMIMDILAAGGKVPAWTEAQMDVVVKEMYKKVAGWDGKLPPDSTDAGTDPTTALNYLQATGFPMPDGTIVKIAGFLAIPLQDEDGNGVWDAQTQEEIDYCLAYFGGGFFCFSVPQSAMTQFDSGQEWTVVTGSPIEGSHMIYQVEQDDPTDETAITWAKPQEMTQAFMKYYGSCFLFPVFQQQIDAAGDTPEGFNWAQIQSMFSVIKGGGVLPPAPAGTTIILTVGDVANIVVVGGNQTCLVNGVATPLDAVPFLADAFGRVYLGLRDVMDLLTPLLPTGSTIAWNGTLKQVTIFVPA